MRESQHLWHLSKLPGESWTRLNSTELGQQSDCRPSLVLNGRAVDPRSRPSLRCCGWRSIVRLKHPVRARFMGRFITYVFAGTKLQTSNDNWMTPRLQSGSRSSVS
jgi:hypothetical protein